MSYEHEEAVRNMVRRATLKKTDDSGSQQTTDLAVLKGEAPTKVYRAQGHGFSSHAPAGSEGVAVQMGGRSDRVLTVGFEHEKHRPKDLKEGGSIQYDTEGQHNRLDDGKTHVQAKDEWKLERGGNSITIDENNVITVDSAEDIILKRGTMIVRIRANRIDLGAMVAPFQVQTTGGPSTKVWAVV